MKKVLRLIVCLMTMVSAKAHNVHYPTYTIDGITYTMNGSWDGRSIYYWQVQKVHKPNDKTIVIPSRVPIDEEYRTEYSGEELHVSTIGEEAFTECTSLDSLIISDGIWIGSVRFSFKGCRPLEYLYYSQGWNAKANWGDGRGPVHDMEYCGLCKTFETTVGVDEKGFWSTVCGNSLEKLIIKGGSNGIIATMNLCKNLKTIICYPIAPPTVRAATGYSYSCEDAKFNSNQWSTVTMYIPRESLEKYYFHEIWGEIDNIYAIDEIPTTTTADERNNTSTSISFVTNSITENDVWYSLDGTKVDNPTKGVYIKDGKKYIIR